MTTARKRLEAILEATGLLAKKSLGQNFLVSDLVISRILTQAQDLKAQHFIEIGPGPGAITEGLLQSGVPLQLIELDRTMAAYWRNQGCEVFEADALQLDWKPLITKPNTVLVSNLPYQISASIVIDRSLDTPGLSAMVLMFQKEVAQRIRAKISTENYGMLSVIAQNFWDVNMVTEAGPKDFWPPPKVASRVLVFRALDTGSLDRRKFLSFVKMAFAQRRKLLKSNLNAWLSSRRMAPDILLAKLAEFGIKETARAEELSPAQFRELYEHLDHSRE